MSRSCKTSIGLCHFVVIESTLDENVKIVKNSTANEYQLCCTDIPVAPQITQYWWANVGSSCWSNVILAGGRNVGPPVANVNVGPTLIQPLHIRTRGSNVGSRSEITWCQHWANVNSSQRWANVTSIGQKDVMPTTVSNVGPTDDRGWSIRGVLSGSTACHKWRDIPR